MARMVLFVRGSASGKRAKLLNEFDARAKVAREAPFDRNGGKPLAFKGSASAREQKV